MLQPEDIDQIKKIVQEELSRIIRIDRFIFDKDIQIADGRGIQAGQNLGLKIGLSTSEKVAFFGATPVARQSTIAVSDPPTQSEVNSIKTALINLGLFS